MADGGKVYVRFQVGVGQVENFMSRVGTHSWVTINQVKTRLEPPLVSRIYF